ncbi:MAG: sugar-binding protein [Caldilineaceae bacterium]
MIHTYRWISVGVFFLLLILVNNVETHVQAQQTNLDEAIKTVVRIRGCNIAGCNVGLGSGVIIHSSGVILTANHVTLTDPRNPLSPRLEDFVIEVTENARQAPEVRYRARLLAAKPEADMALLGIYWDELTAQAVDDPDAVNLPALTIANVNLIGLGDPLHILGYPLAGGAAINYTEVALGGFDENGALLKVNASLNEGYSGGPLLVKQDGHYEIAGVVILRRADVSFIRSIDQLSGLAWEPTARRVWADNIQTTVQGSGTNAVLQISVDIHMLDYVNRKGRLLAYLFDIDSLQPWPAGNSGLDRSTNGQVVLYRDFSATRVIDLLQPLTLALPLSQLNTQLDKLIFKLLLWDVNEVRGLWRDAQPHRPLTFIQTPEAPMISVIPTEIIVIAVDTTQPTVNEDPTSTYTPTEESKPAEPLATLTLEAAFAIINQPINVRGGPGTNYPIIGAAQPSEQFIIKGKNPDSTWLQIDYGGRDGWVFNQLVILQNAGLVPTVQATPTAPLLTATPTAVLPAFPTPIVTSVGIITASVQTRPTAQGFFLAPGPVSRVLDANFNDWLDSWIPITTVVQGVENFSGTQDIAGEFQTAWSPQGLYLAIKVSDDYYRSGPNGTDMWQGDSLEIHLDRILADDYNTAIADGDDYMLGISFGSNVSEIRAYLWLPLEREGTLNILGTVAASDQGYGIELLVPWEIFSVDGKSLGTGQVYGFNISISDNDSDILKQETVLSGSPNRTTYNNPMEWGTLILASPDTLHTSSISINEVTPTWTPIPSSFEATATWTPEPKE